MKVIIPVAGIGTRLRPHTHAVPKPLLPVAGKSVLAHVIDPLLSLDIEEVIFVVGYRGEMIRTFIEENYSFEATFIYQEELHGLGYAVNMAMEQITDGSVLIVLGDTIAQCDMAQLVKAGKNVLGLMPVEDPKRFGIADIKDGSIVSFVEKPENPPSNLAIIGLYYFDDARLLKQLLAEHVKSGKTTRGEIQLTDALEMMLQQGEKFTPFEVDRWLDCGKKETLLETNRTLLEQKSLPAKGENSTIIPPVYIDPEAKIINSVVGPYVSISGGTVIDRAIVKNSIIGNDTVIRNFIIENSLIGDSVNLIGKSRILNLGHHDDLHIS